MINIITNLEPVTLLAIFFVIVAAPVAMVAMIRNSSYVPAAALVIIPGLKVFGWLNGIVVPGQVIVIVFLFFSFTLLNFSRSSLFSIFSLNLETLCVFFIFVLFCIGTFFVEDVSQTLSRKKVMLAVVYCFMAYYFGRSFFFLANPPLALSNMAKVFFVVSFLIILPFTLTPFLSSDLVREGSRYGHNDNIDTAIFLSQLAAVSCTVCFAAFVYYSSQKSPYRIYYLLGIVASSFVLLMTVTRGATFSTIVTLLIVGYFGCFFKVKNMIFSISFGIVLVVILSIVLPDSSKEMLKRRFFEGGTTASAEYSNGRFEHYNQALTMFMESPLIGRGSASFTRYLAMDERVISGKMIPDADNAYFPHNVFMEFLSENGIIGFLLFSTLVFLSIKNLIFLWNSPNYGDEVKLLFLSMGCITFLLMQTSSSLTNFPIFWFVCGVLSGVGRQTVHHDITIIH